MKWKTWLPLVMALALGLVAAKLAKDFVSRSRNAAAPMETVAVVVATRDITPGEELTEKDLAIESAPVSKLPAGTINQIAAVTGRVVESRIVKGQMLLETLLTPPETHSGLQALVPQGLRALTLEINEFSGVAGHLVPGCRIDIIATLQDQQTQEYFTKTIAQAIPVTAVGRRLNTGEPSEVGGVARSVTLVVSPQQAELIQLTSVAAKCTLVLRGSRDRTNNLSEGLTLGDILGARQLAKAGPAPHVAQAQPDQGPLIVPATQPTIVEAVFPRTLPRPRRTVEVIVGTSVTRIEMPLADHSSALTGTDTQEVTPEPKH